MSKAHNQVTETKFKNIWILIKSKLKCSVKACYLSLL